MFRKIRTGFVLISGGVGLGLLSWLLQIWTVDRLAGYPSSTFASESFGADKADAYVAVADERVWVRSSRV